MLMCWYNQITFDSVYTTSFPSPTGILSDAFGIDYGGLSVGHFIDKWDRKIDVKEEGWELSTITYGSTFYVKLIVLAFHGRR